MKMQIEALQAYKSEINMLCQNFENEKMTFLKNQRLEEMVYNSIYLGMVVATNEFYKGSLKLRNKALSFVCYTEQDFVQKISLMKNCEKLIEVVEMSINYVEKNNNFVRRFKTHSGKKETLDVRGLFGLMNKHEFNRASNVIKQFIPRIDVDKSFMNSLTDAIVAYDAAEKITTKSMDIIYLDILEIFDTQITTHFSSLGFNSNEILEKLYITNNEEQEEEFEEIEMEVEENEMAFYSNEEAYFIPFTPTNEVAY